MIYLDQDQWRIVADCLKKPRKTSTSKGGGVNGRPRVPDHDCFEGVLYVLVTGAKWKNIPPEYPSPVTCWRRLQEWVLNRQFEPMWRKYLTVIDMRTAAIWHASFSKAEYFQDNSHLKSRSATLFQRSERVLRAKMARIFLRKFGKLIRSGVISSELSFDAILDEFTQTRRNESDPSLRISDDDNQSRDPYMKMDGYGKKPSQLSDGPNPPKDHRMNLG